MFITALSTTAKEWKQLSVHERMNGSRICGILVIRKNEILLFATTWTDLEGVMLSETVRERQINIV